MLLSLKLVVVKDFASHLMVLQRYVIMVVHLVLVEIRLISLELQLQIIISLDYIDQMQAQVQVNLI